MIKNIVLAMGLAGFLSVSSVSAFAQSAAKFDIGMKGGVGGYCCDSGGTSPALGTVGVEFCAYCAGRFGLFGEYSHWFGERNSADLAGLGVRIQGKRAVRPFFDFCASAGRDTVRRSVYDTAGLVLGAGVAIPIKQRFYLRPQVRLYGRGESHLDATAQVGFGWRF